MLRIKLTMLEVFESCWILYTNQKIIKLEIITPSNTNSARLKRLVESTARDLFIISGNRLTHNIIAHKTQIINTIIITLAANPLSVKNPPGYVEIKEVIIIKNIINDALP